MTDTVTETEPIVGQAGEIQRLAVGPQAVAVLAGKELGSPVGIIDYTIAPGFSPPPHLHRHTREDAGWIVLDGAVEFHTADGSCITVEAGSSFVHPRGCWFRWRNPDADRPARAICWFSPAGFEQFFVDLAAAAADHFGNGGSMEDFTTHLVALRHRYGMEPHPSAGVPAPETA